MRDGMIIDLFAGGGGASVGIEMALGRPVDIAVNHDPQAIRMHQTNHPNTLHLTEDVFKVNLKKYVKGRHVALMWASPDCTSHSKAKGGKPRERGLRVLPWAVHKHAKDIKPDVIIMENVEEIQDWGPLDEKGYPIPDRKGEDYRKFVSAMERLGYEFDSMELVAADYGAPTTRKRWYAIFRRDGKPIIWPEQTHSKNGTGGKEPWVPVSTVLNFSDFGKSIFGRKKPLADNTMRRIARGLDKFVIHNPEPFIVQVNHAGDNFRGQRTVTPYAVPIGYGERNGQAPRVNSVKEPIGTIVASGTKHYLCSPYMIQYHSETAKGEVRGQEVSRPIQTIDTSNRYGLVTAFMTKFYKQGTGQVINEPLHTITTSPGHFGQVSEFIMEYYGCGTGQSVKEPLHTVVTKDRFALVTILGNQYVILDIFLRMLTPEELKLAQGFPKDYIIDRDYAWRAYPKAEQVHRIGNSVVPIMAKVLVESNCSYLKAGERQPAPVVYTKYDGQIAFA